MENYNKKIWKKKRNRKEAKNLETTTTKLFIRLHEPKLAVKKVNYLLKAK